MLLLWLHLGLFAVECVALFLPPQCAFGVAWGVVCVLLFLHRWSALVGWLSVLECALWGFLPLFTLLHLFPLSRLCNTPLISCSCYSRMCLCSFICLVHGHSHCTISVELVHVSYTVLH